MSPPPPRWYVPPDYEFASEVDVTDLGCEPDRPAGIGDVTGLAHAIRSARDAGVTCFLTEHGRRVAAIVPAWEEP
jgi:hypothetical protein